MTVRFKDPLAARACVAKFDGQSPSHRSSAPSVSHPPFRGERSPMALLYIIR